MRDTLTQEQINMAMEASIKALGFTMKISEIMVFIYDTFNAIKDKVPEYHQRDFLNILSYTDKMLNDPSYWKVSLPDEERKDFKKHIAEEYIKTFSDKFASYYLNLFNQGLVMLCTIFENYLYHVVDKILTAQPKILLKVSEQKEVTLKKVMELENYNAIINEFKEKYLKQFDRSFTTKEQLDFFREMCGLEDKDFINYDNIKDDAKIKQEQWPVDKLKEIFDRRHNIVHKDSVEITNLEDLTLIADFFQKIMLFLGHSVGRKFKLFTDVNVHLLYDKIKPSEKS